MSSSFEGIYEPGIVDPGVPVPNSTRSFWQSDPSKFTNHCSPWPNKADVLIIGSGISGTIVAKTLFDHRPDLSIVMVEARTLCSGATGRNGGHIKTRTYSLWLERKQRYGIDEAVRLTEFEQSHLHHISDAVRDTKIDCDLVHTDGVDAYFDKTQFSKDVAALEDMRRYAPQLAARYASITDPAVLRQWNLSPRCIGAIKSPAASTWPYKFVTGLQEKMIRENNLNIQTNTAVHEIEDTPNAEYASVKTSRGGIQARQVIHATNAWIGHLIPELRPYISPVRGNATRQLPEKADSPGIDPRVSYWLFYGPKDYDYLIQKTDGSYVVGRANTQRRATGDDSQTDVSPIAHLRGVASEIYRDKREAPSVARDASSTVRTDVTHAWSGILGFTQDGSTFVGRLPFPGRSHQWICGGYHGMGMIKAFRSAQTAALMVLGKDLPEEFPRSGLITEGRIRDLHHSLGSTKLLAKM